MTRHEVPRHEVRRREVRTPLILHAPVPEAPRENEVRTPIAVETLVRPEPVQVETPPMVVQPVVADSVVPEPVVAAPVAPPVVVAPPAHVWWLRHQGPRPWWLHANPHAVAHVVGTPAAGPAPARSSVPATSSAPVAEASPRPRVQAPRPAGPERVPLSAYLLRLQTVKLRGWQRVLLFEGTFLLAVVVALADFATAWLPVVVPFAVGAMLKLHDVVLTQLHRNARAQGHQR